MLEGFNRTYRVGVPLEDAKNNEYRKYKPVKTQRHETIFIYRVLRNGVQICMRNETYKAIRDYVPIYLRNTKFSLVKRHPDFRWVFLITNTLPQTQRTLHLIYKEAIFRNKRATPKYKDTLSTAIIINEKEEEL